jgi:hypothetical protein
MLCALGLRSLRGRGAHSGSNPLCGGLFETNSLRNYGLLLHDVRVFSGDARCGETGSRRVGTHPHGRQNAHNSMARMEKVYRLDAIGTAEAIVQENTDPTRVTDESFPPRRFQVCQMRGHRVFNCRSYSTGIQWWHTGFRQSANTVQAL